MKQRGITLIEMLGVMIILALLMTLIVPIATTIIDNSKESLYNQQLENIRNGAKSYAGEHIFDLPDVGEETLILNLNDDLIKNGYVDKDITNPLTGEPFNNIEVYIINENGKIVYDIYENGNLINQDDNRTS